MKSLVHASIAEPERTRLSNHCQKIIERLRQGSATNEELNGICFRYSARIHELRGAGYGITIERLGGGLSRYRLVREQGVTERCEQMRLI